MNLTIQQPTLSHALSTVARAVSPRASLPVLANILLDATPDGVRLSATNLEMGIVINAPAVSSKPGSTTVPARTFVDLVSTLTGTIELSLNKSMDLMTVKSGGSKTNLKCIAAAEFPPMPAMPDPAAMSLPTSTLKEMIAQVAFSASTDEARPILTGVLFDARGGILTLAAADGFRLSVCKRPVDVVAQHNLPQYVIPARALTELARVATAETVAIAFPSGRGQAIFQSGDVTLISQLVEGTFPDYEQIIPRRHETRTTVKVADLLQAVRQAEIFAREGNHVCKLHFCGPKHEETPQMLFVAGQSEETGQAESAIPIDIDGDGVLIAFNARFLAEYLDAAKTSEVVIETATATSPGVFRSGEDWLFVIMPVHLND